MDSINYVYMKLILHPSYLKLALTESERCDIETHPVITKTNKYKN